VLWHAPPLPTSQLPSLTSPVPLLSSSPSPLSLAQQRGPAQRPYEGGEGGCGNGGAGSASGGEEGSVSGGKEGSERESGRAGIHPEVDTIYRLIKHIKPWSMIR